MVIVPNLHPELEGFSIKLQELIIRHSIGEYVVNEDGLVELYIKLRDSADDVELDDLGIILWEPFEHYDNIALWSAIDSKIWSMKSFVEAMAEIGRVES